MKTATLYLRTATGSVAGSDQLKDQLNTLKKFCNDRKIEVIAHYADVGSGATFEREGFQMMLNKIKSGEQKPDVILITLWDRFSRNLTGALEMIKTLRALGVKVKSLQDFESNDFEIILKHSLTKKK